jgi:hypothetical protein
LILGRDQGYVYAVWIAQNPFQSFFYLPSGRGVTKLLLKALYVRDVEELESNNAVSKLTLFASTQQSPQLEPVAC